MAEIIKVWDPKGNVRLIGYLDGITFSKNIDEEKHIFQNLEALTLDLEVFNKIKAKIHEIIYKSPQRTFITTPQRFLTYGRILPATKKARAHIALHLDYWSIMERKADQPELFNNKNTTKKDNRATVSNPTFYKLCEAPHSGRIGEAGVEASVIASGSFGVVDNTPPRFDWERGRERLAVAREGKYE